MTIERFAPIADRKGNAFVEPDPNGGYVYFSDFEAAQSEASVLRERLSEILDDIKRKAVFCRELADSTKDELLWGQRIAKATAYEDAAARHQALLKGKEER